MKKFGLLLSILVLVSQMAWGQLLNENFEYSTGQLTAVNGGANVSGGNWVSYSGTTLPLQVTSGSLTYTGYSSSGIGNKVDVINGSAEDAYRQFTTQGVGTKTYAAFIMNVSTTTGLLANTITTGDYTVSFLPSTSTTALVGRISLRAGSVANTFNVGMRTSSSNTAAVWNTTDYPINTPILVVFSYESIAGNTNDIANLWVNPAIGGSEPAADVTQTSALAADPVDIARITIRQGTNSFPGQLDGIRVGTTWAFVTEAAATTPTILVNPTSLSGFTYVVGSGPSDEQSFSVSGSNLTDDISIAASTNYEISETSGSGYTTPIVLTQTDGNVDETTIYVRLKAGLSVGDYNSEDITASSTDATDRIVTCSGSVTPQSVLTVVPTALSGFDYVVGSGSSSAQTYLLSGTNLNGSDVTITAPSNYEISLNNSTWTDNTTLTAFDGSATTIYVRLKSGLVVGIYGGNVSNAGGGAAIQDVVCSGRVMPVLPNAWINELHYDNASTDATEFVEVVIQNPESYNLSDFTITLYNGSGGVSYNTKLVSAFTVGVADPVDPTMRYYYFIYPVDGIQNGAPDGICLDYQGYPILFISYEGTFTATDGPANGFTSQDIGVSESSLTLLNSSLGLTGSGTTYSDFTWTVFSEDATTGDPNTGQALPVELTSFSAATIGSDIKLSWKTATEINNYGFEIQKSGVGSQKTEWSAIGFVNGNGNSNSPKNYSFVDDNVTAGKYSYRLKQIDNDGQFEYSKTVEVNLGAPKKFELSQNYPNPFNPTTTISYNIPEATNVKLTIFNILGQEIKTLVNEFNEAGVHTVNFNASELNSGLYIYKLQAGTFTQTRKMTLIK